MGKPLSAGDLLAAGQARGRTQASRPEQGEHVPEARASRGRYSRVVYLTEDQHRWARSVTALARRDGLSLSRSDVVRLAVGRARAEADERELGKALVALARTERHRRG